MCVDKCLDLHVACPLWQSERLGKRKLARGRKKVEEEYKVCSALSMTRIEPRAVCGTAGGAAGTPCMPVEREKSVCVCFNFMLLPKAVNTINP